MNAILVAGAVVLGFVVFQAMRGGARVEPSRAHRMVRDGALLLDVRTPPEFAGGHVEGAVNIPVSELQTRRAELGDPGRTVVVYCRSGVRSARACRVLRAQRFNDVHDLGSIRRWPGAPTG